MGLPSKDRERATDLGLVAAVVIEDFGAIGLFKIDNRARHRIEGGDFLFAFGDQNFGHNASLLLWLELRVGGGRARIIVNGEWLIVNCE